MNGAWVLAATPDTTDDMNDDETRRVEMMYEMLVRAGSNGLQKKNGGDEGHDQDDDGH